jgi:hypothetical protein
LGNIDTLTLNVTEVDEPSFAALARSVRTRELSVVSGRAVSDDSLLQLASCKYIEKLTVYVSPLNSPERHDTISIKAWAAKLGESRTLRDLRLFGLPVDDSAIAHIGRAKGLQRLEIGLTKNLSESSLAAISRFPALQRFEYVVDLNGAAHLSALRNAQFAVHLAVSFPHERKEPAQDFVDLAQIRRLESLTLYLAKSNVAKDVWDRLALAPHLHQLTLNSATLSENDCAGISQLRKLDKLSIQSSRIVGDGVQRFRAMSNLKELSCGGTKLNEFELAELERALPSLRIIR